MLTDLFWAGAMLAVSVAIHAAVIARLLRTLARTPAGELPLGRLTARLIGVAGRLVASHLLQVACWGTYFTLAGAFADLPTATYFSMVTYTTVGYGDLVPAEGARLAAGVLGLTGILMCGWSTGFFFAVVGRLMAGEPAR